MSKPQLVLMDMREISLETSPGLFMELLAGERSLCRRVLISRQIRRLQPNKPSTKAQAAVALTSGRMAEAIHSELLRLEAEEFSREVASGEIKQELLDRGEIKSYRDEKIEEENAHTLQPEQLYVEALHEPEEDKLVKQIVYDKQLKEKAAIGCQRHLLRGLEVEVNEMSKRLEHEPEEHVADEETLRAVFNKLQIKKEGIRDAKSWLQVEIEALRILRLWIEDEASKRKSRALVLEEVGQRWRWRGNLRKQRA